ncbi:MAG: hypothetical protein D6698_06730 [Gammaproteobacteria bacterium]|nr:MAG: hypothetical protein D6698_06730 [Gammaproteobacteria bacterium]
MHVTFGGKLIGELQGLSYTVQREKAPIYTMGNADPRSFSRGKRGIAGSLVFKVFDRSALLEAFRDQGFIANRNDTPSLFVIGDVNIPTIEKASGMIGTLDGSANPTVSVITLDKILARPRYPDQILPFDIVITAANEYGSFSRMSIHGVEILNVGSGMSIDDMSTDEACTFVATSITPWNSQGFVKTLGQGKTKTI